MEEIAAIFGDADEVAIYQAEMEIDKGTGQVMIHRASEKTGGEGNMVRLHTSSEDAADKV